MKKLIILTAMIIPLFLSACSSGSDNDNTPSYPSVTGSWLMQGDLHEVFTFNADGTYAHFLSKKDYDANKTYKNGSYTYNGTSITLDGGFPETVTWAENKQSFRWRTYQWNKIK